MINLKPKYFASSKELKVPQVKYVCLDVKTYLKCRVVQACRRALCAPFPYVLHEDTLKKLFLQACMQDSSSSAVNRQQYQKVVTSIFHVSARFEARFITLSRSRLLKFSLFHCSAGFVLPR